MKWLHCRMWSCLPPPLPGPGELDGPVHAASSPEPSPATVSVPVVLRNPRLESPVPPPLPASPDRSSASLRMAHPPVDGVTSCQLERTKSPTCNRLPKRLCPLCRGSTRQARGSGHRAPDCADPFRLLAAGGLAHYDARDRPTGGRRRARSPTPFKDWSREARKGANRMRRTLPPCPVGWRLS